MVVALALISILQILVAQGRSHRVPHPPPAIEEASAATSVPTAPAHTSGRETFIAEDPPAPEVHHRPAGGGSTSSNTWLFGLAGVFWVLVALKFDSWRRRRATERARREAFTPRPAASVSAIEEATAQPLEKRPIDPVVLEHMERANPREPSLKIAGPRRSAKEQREIYLTTLHGAVSRLIGRNDIQCVEVPDAPKESRWRAWLYGESWEVATVRASGHSEGHAWKALLSEYQRGGGSWISYAAERDRSVPIVVPAPAPPVAETAPSPSAPAAAPEVIGLLPAPAAAEQVADAV